MNAIKNTIFVSALLLAAPLVIADSEKDCLLQGTVVHGEQAGQDTTMVRINSVTRYEEDSRCKVRRGQKMEFNLPPDTRLKEAASGSEVKYRYRSDGSGQSNAELISIGA